ncbi:MAG: hypothetical protein IBX49_06990, partial [Gammaproteobacteria bacterium]|nr:hypothetical protein [Gammaproteobacteria bacterium]
DWQPIGSAEEPFTGSLTSSEDGVARSITGLNGEPLFDAIGPGAEVSDLIIAGSVNGDAGSNAGLLANTIHGEAGNEVRIDNITIDSDSRIDGGTNDYIGGLAGTIDYADLNNIIVDGEVKGRDYVGGIGGHISNSTITDSTVSGDVEGQHHVGGIGGELDGSSVNDTTVSGDVTGSGDNVGGIGGEVNDSSIDNATVEGNVAGQDYVGGIGGQVNDSSISGTTVTGNVDGNDNVGGVGGSIANSELDDTHVEGDVTGSGDNVGDLAGQIEGEVRIDDEAPGIYDEEGHMMGDQSVATGEPVRFRIPFGNVTTSGTVTRGGDTQTLAAATWPELLTDPDGGTTILRIDGEGYYIFEASRGGSYTLQFNDGAYTFTIAFEVRPQVAFSSIRQYGTDGEVVEIRAVLEGSPGQYPVVVPYELIGTELIGDSDGLERDNGTLKPSGEFLFEEGQHERLRHLTLTPNATTGTIRMTLTQGDGPEHAILGDPAVHEIVLLQGEVIPLSVGVSVVQDQSHITDGVVVVGEGEVTLTVDGPQGGSIAWDGHYDLGLAGHETSEFTIDGDALVQLAGSSYGFEVIVTDFDTGRTGTAQGRLRVVSELPVGYHAVAGDRDEPHRLLICTEGEFRSVGAGHCETSSQDVPLEVPEGYGVRMGETAERVSWGEGHFGTGIHTDDLQDANGSLALNRTDRGFAHLGYLVDFEVFDLQYPGQSVPVVIPLALDETIPAEAVWRKWHGSEGWRDFREDEANGLYSAARMGDGCPWPGSDRWQAGLNEGDHCIRLIIEDGGPNDLDGRADGVIRDPGTLAVPAAAAGSNDARLISGGGAIGGWLLLGLGGMLLVARLGTARRGLWLAASALLLLSLPAQGEPPTDREEHRWYVGGQLGYAHSADVSSSSVTEGMARAGIAGSAQVSDRTRPTWRLFGGYRLSEHLALEGGYTDLGEITTRFLDVDPEIDVDTLEGVRPTSGRGLEVAGIFHWPVHEQLGLYARAGIWHWQARYKLQVDGEWERKTVSGSSGLFGVGAALHWNAAWSSRLSVDRYRSDGEDHDLLGVSLVRRF